RPPIEIARSLRPVMTRVPKGRLLTIVTGPRSLLRFSKRHQKRNRAKKSPKLKDRDVSLPKITRLDPAPYYLSVVAIVKNEVRYLEEWLDFHCLVGCSHFYIYDNGSTDGTADLLRKYECKGIVTVTP